MGWITWHRPPTLSFSTYDNFGVKIFTGRKTRPKPPLRLSASESAAEILRSYLQKGGVDARIGAQFQLGPELPPDTMLISVGPKPTVEDAIAELSGTMTPVNDVVMYGNRVPIPDSPPNR